MNREKGADAPEQPAEDRSVKMERDGYERLNDPAVESPEYQGQYSPPYKARHGFLDRPRYSIER